MNWDDELNDEQRTACSVSLEHHCLLAGPGTGKTRVLTHRVAYIHDVHDVPLEKTLVLTFTRSTAAELRNRLRRDFGDKYGLVRVSTVHAFALRQLIRNDAAPAAPERVTIADDYDESEVILPDLRRRLGLNDVRQVRRAIFEIAAGWADLSAEQQGWAEAHPQAALLGALREHRAVYAYTLRAELVYRFYRALVTKPEFDLESFDHILVDEYQDLTECELRVLRHLANHGATLYVAGDDDQAIYGWRNATPDGIRRFEADYGPNSFVRLQRCQRCDRSILELAGKVAAQDPERIPKGIEPQSTGQGTVECFSYKSDISEAKGVVRLCARWRDADPPVPLEQMLVLARTKGDVTRIREALQGAEGLQVAEDLDPYAEIGRAHV